MLDIDRVIMILLTWHGVVCAKEFTMWDMQTGDTLMHVCIVARVARSVLQKIIAAQVEVHCRIIIKNKYLSEKLGIVDVT